MFRGKPEILGVSSDPRITLNGGDALADLASCDNSEFPILETYSIRPDHDNDCWTNAGDGKDPVKGGTLQIGVKNVEVLKNVRCRLLVEGNDQLATSIRCGIVIKDVSNAEYYYLLNGLAGNEDVDISCRPYSIGLPDIHVGDSLSVTAYIWVDRTALAEAGTYNDNEMEVSLIFY